RADIMADFSRTTGRADPVVHFYETFLKEYDPQVREMRGVYYTPAPVVSYMVRSVDHLLKTRFGLPKGLADTAQTEYEVEGDKGEKVTKTGPRVLILDPACGTGTFLFEIVNHIRNEFIRKRQSGAWSSYVREHLLSRLFGFELLMAPYAMAHLKLGLQLAGQDLDEPARSSYAYDFAGDERLGVYLTNTLEEAARKAETLFGPLRVITEEANAAAEIKRDKPIMVVIGNPPYSGHSANRSWETKNGKRIPTFIGKLLQDYYQVDGKPLGERTSKWLQDDYVKFIRFGQWRIEQSGGGILALITNHSYLDSPTFRGMRQQLMQAFTDIYVLNLHGNSRKKEVCPDGSKDENVFDIQQGVAIAIFVKEPDTGDPARVWHADLWGLRGSKEERLFAQTCEAMQWRELQPRSPVYLFVPQASELAGEYDAYLKVTEAMPLHGVGMTTARDSMVIDFEPDRLIRRAQAFRDSTASDEELCRELGIPQKKGWNIAKARRDLQQERDLSEFVETVLYRPFDKRLIFYHDSLVWRTVKRIMRHMLGVKSIALLAKRQSKRDPFSYVWCTDVIAESCVFESAYANNTIFPMCLYPLGTPGSVSRDQMLHEAQQRLAAEGGDTAAQKRLAHTIRRLFPDPEYPRWPNLDPLLLADLEERLGLKCIPDGTGDRKKTFGPEDVFNYIYAILHSPSYRERYADFLKRDFPRIPFTSDRKLFATLAEKGRQLVAYHLLESEDLAGAAQPLSGDGDNRVERVRYDAKEGRVYISKTQHFPNVPSDVWNFKVGGYQVCDKWLKDRKGRPLLYADQEHYTKVTIALRETIRLMKEIDAAIPSWPIT
ncbi:MAG TPA: type ISP restriction/modification enzyme, partial [Phycisphaerae bacterium]|nr:type ISP restriction/modification enzyme [Phycisphaerae bacterium]